MPNLLALQKAAASKHYQYAKSSRSYQRLLLRTITIAQAQYSQAALLLPIEKPTKDELQEISLGIST